MPFIKGYKATEEHKKRLSESHKGKPPWNKGLKGYLKGREITWSNKISLGKKNSLKSTLASKRSGKIMVEGNKGRKLSEEHRMKISEAQKRIGNKPPVKRGKESYRWRGGITPINKAIRNSLEYKLWRTSVFERDNYTCVWCGLRGVCLHADHIKPFAYFPGLRFAIDNGRTLCEDCHKTTDTYMGRGKIYAK